MWIKCIKYVNIRLDGISPMKYKAHMSFHIGNCKFRIDGCYVPMECTPRWSIA